MPRLSDFRCLDCLTVAEDWVSGESLAANPCPGCGSAHRQRLIGGARIDYIGMATDGVQSSDGLTSTIDRWDRMRQKQMKIEQRNMRNHGDYY